MLASAFLGEPADSRMKMSFVPYYRRLARRMHQAYPELFSEESIARRRGSSASGLAAIHDPAWLIDSLGIAMLETWLRQSGRYLRMVPNRSQRTSLHR